MSKSMIENRVGSEVWIFFFMSIYKKHVGILSLIQPIKYYNSWIYNVRLNDHNFKLHITVCSLLVFNFIIYHRNFIVFAHRFLHFTSYFLKFNYLNLIRSDKLFV